MEYFILNEGKTKCLGKCNMTVAPAYFDRTKRKKNGKTCKIILVLLQRKPNLMSDSMKQKKTLKATIYGTNIRNVE